MKGMNMKKAAGAILSAIMIVSLLAGGGYAAQSAFDGGQEIGVVSREDGSGTRGAFIELFGIEVRNADGTRKDMTTKEAVIANQTNVMMTNIAGNKYGIGYISLGSLNQTVKALNIGGVKATVENVKNGTYAIARPFNIATKGEPKGLVKDFIGFILSAQGQAVVAKGYISIDEKAPAYSGSKPASTGKIVVGGSSSVTPVMERLKEAYIALNPGAAIEIQQSDSSAGLKDAINGVCDIAMASRELKASELEQLSPIQIALDGIAVIVNNQNPLANLTKDQVKAIFTGETTRWNDLSR
ncbi:MAG: substrate-binding domain-containing protein [Synergistaceae bacterium]|jgi:phosphate transport system substrate-binding protein|nr:substrate-binding domain-containing protein [Synergistaceae bacterium]